MSICSMLIFFAMHKKCIKNILIIYSDCKYMISFMVACGWKIKAMI
jgi:hypothetical protein